MCVCLNVYARNKLLAGASVNSLREGQYGLGEIFGPGEFGPGEFGPGDLSSLLSTLCLHL